VIVFAALALVQGLALARVRAWKTLVPALAALAFVAVISNWRIRARDSQIGMSHINAGAALMSVERFDEAQEQFETGLKLDPDAAEGWANLGGLHGRLGRMDQAIENLKHALVLRPDDPVFRMRLGTAYYMNHDATHAVEELTRSTELYPQDPQAWNNLRFIYIQAKDWARAVDVARRGVMSNPDDIGLNMSLAWLLAAAPDERLVAPAEATAIAKRCVDATGRTNADALNVLAAALARSGRFEEAHATAVEALGIAERSGLGDLVAEIRARVDLYARKKPYIEGQP
jgi:Flp pilus assembly protein TadD